MMEKAIDIAFNCGSDPSKESADETEEEETVEGEVASAHVKREREPFRFHLYRNRSGEVDGWTLLHQRMVDGRPSLVPVTVSQPASGNIWFEYPVRWHADRNADEHETYVYEFGEGREEVVPSNAFYKWLSQYAETLVAFNEFLQTNDTRAIKDPEPDRPPLYADLADYEKKMLDRFHNLVNEYREFTDDQYRLIVEGIRRYPPNEQTQEAFDVRPETEDDE